ncbi:UDP-2,3-diacylglucosamine diphosphatase [Aquimarina agarilytica]|uniref:UDP-2,3-diacylglucosamine diphosphatase n=1 Tax=Aquimarina agarilytica TaxID=1087449 RepID=UPI0002881B75|nr:UDP-2,3-diacylglucosamine diphosphatase [Aquimarina agarilytica]
MKKRVVEVLVLSDIHLGTYGCHAKELLLYLKSIKPKRVILNGDIIDIWQFKKRYWPKSHMKVVKHVMQWITKGISVTYITGNHDEMLRKFEGFQMGSFKIVNKLLLNIGNESAWIFHGDVFDVTMQHSKWIAKLGAMGYDLLILLNSGVNYMSKKMGREPVSMSKKIKNSVKSAVKFINDFEKIAADIAIDNRYDYVICGHIHQPEIRRIENDQGGVMYLNSGDWIENLTALEYNEGAWQLYEFATDIRIKGINNMEVEYQEVLETEVLFKNMLEEFQLMKSDK